MWKTVETLQVRTDRRNSVTVEKNTHRDDIDEVMGDGGGDEEEDGESEDDNEDGPRGVELMSNDQEQNGESCAASTSELV